MPGREQDLQRVRGVAREYPPLAIIDHTIGSEMAIRPCVRAMRQPADGGHLSRQCVAGRRLQARRSRRVVWMRMRTDDGAHVASRRCHQSRRVRGVNRTGVNDDVARIRGANDVGVGARASHHARVGTG